MAQASHAARRDTPAKENTGERAKEKARGGVQAHDLTGLVTALHIMVERASAPPQLARDPRTLHRFDKLIWCRCLRSLGAISAEFCQF